MKVYSRYRCASLTQLTSALSILSSLAVSARADDPPPAPVDAETVVLPLSPPSEIDAAAKLLEGTWRCQGSTKSSPTSALEPTRGVLKIAIDLDHWWISSTYIEAKKNGVKLVEHRSYDSAAHVWTRVTLNNMGGYNVTTAQAANDKGELIWEPAASATQKPSLRSREHEVADGKRISLLGEVATDDKSWMKIYDLACKQ